MHKINALIQEFLGRELPQRIQYRFRAWMLAESDRKAKNDALLKAWNDRIAQPDEKDFRHKLPEIHRRIDALERHDIHRSRRRWLLRIPAAAAMLALLIGGEYLLLRGKYTDAQSVCLITAQGSKGEFLLPDGTRVWLNGDSRLSYPRTFGNDRKVELDGEAFFDVAHDASKPFIVNMEVMQVKVLGTEFDARHRSGDRYAETILKSGSVQVFAPGLKKNVTLQPNERIQLDTRCGKIALCDVSVDDYCNWMARRMTFANKPLSAILINLERWYNVEFRLTADIDLSEKLSFQVEFESLDETMHLISRIASVNYSIRGDEVFLAPK